MPQFMELRFHARDGVDVHDPSAGRSGLARVIGKIFDAESGAYVRAKEPGLLRITHAELNADRVFLRKAVQTKALVCADQATADALGLPLAPPAPTRAEPAAPAHAPSPGADAPAVPTTPVADKETA